MRKILPTLTLVLDDGAVPRVDVPDDQDRSVAIGESWRQPFIFVRSNGARVDMTGGAMVQAVKRNGRTVLSREANLSAGDFANGEGFCDYDPVDTIAFKKGICRTDYLYTDAAGASVHPMLASNLEFLETVAMVGDTVTPAPGVTPLAQGPIGPTGATGPAGATGVTGPTGTSGALAAIGVQYVPGTLITKYVRSTGNDTTGDGTLALPYLTPERAIQDCPSNPSGRSFRVDMSGYGTYTPSLSLQLPVIVAGQTAIRPSTGGAEALLFGTYRNADVEFYAAPTVEATLTSGQYTVAQYGGAGNRAAHTVVTVTASPGWTVNAHVGKMLNITGNGSCGRVISNTADTLTVSLIYGFSSASTLKLCSENCSIDLTTAGFWLASGLRGRGFAGSLTVAGIKFVNGAYAEIDFRCLGETRFIGCYNVAVYNHYGDTIILLGCDVRLYFLANCNKAEMWNCVYTDLAVHENARGSLYVYGCYGTGGDSIGEGNYHGSGTDNNAARHVSVFFTTHRDTGRAGVRLVGAGNTLAVGYCHFEACSYGGILLALGANGYINGPISGPAGATTPSYAGALVLDTSKLIIATNEALSPLAALDSTNITITGSNGDLVVAANAALTWATFFVKKVEADLFRTGARVEQPSATMYRLKVMTPTMAAKTATYTAVDCEIVRCDPTGGAFSVTLPAAAASSRVTVANQGASANAITISPTGGDTIGGAASGSISSARGSRTYESDGVSDWMLVASA